MPRVKQSPRKNLRDIPNPTNWASILRNNHRKYFYLIYAVGWDRIVVLCGRMGTFCGWMVFSRYNFKNLYFTLYHKSIQPCGQMRRDGYMLWRDGYILQRDGCMLWRDG